MSSLQDGFKGFYNEFKDWNKKELLQRLYDICIDGINKQAEINKKDEEIDRLNNIINEIEAIIYNEQLTGIEARIEIQERLDKLKELKEDK